MPLMEHVRELRSRIFRSLIAIIVGTVIAWIFYRDVLDWLTAPYEQVRPSLEAAGIDTQLIMSGFGGAFNFQLKLSLIGGLVLASPFWLWQLWAFVLPALHRHERRLAVTLTAICVPLFIGGVFLGYWIFPKAIELLVGFVPDGWTNLVTGADYLTFAIRMMLLFGIGAQLPVIVVMLNRMGILSSKALINARPWIIVGIFVFAAVATPTVDPITFLFLGIPMTALHLMAERIAVFADRKRGRLADSFEDDMASEIDSPESVDEPDDV